LADLKVNRKVDRMASKMAGAMERTMAGLMARTLVESLGVMTVASRERTMADLRVSLMVV
jgi:hypothetical protein